MSIDELAIQHGSDKSSLYHGFAEHYERYFEPLRARPVRLLEVGYQFGLGMKVWLDYFHSLARFAAVDCVDNQVGCEDPRFSFAVGDQGKREFWEGYKPFGGGAFDIIIDDASHRASDQQETFNALWPRLAPGGYYAIEDTQTWCDAHFDSLVSGVRWMGVLIGCLNRNGKVYHGKPYPQPGVALDELEQSIAFIHFYNGLVIMKKQ